MSDYGDYYIVELDDDTDEFDLVETVNLRTAKFYIHRKKPRTTPWLTEFEKTAVVDFMTRVIDVTGQVDIPKELIDNYGHTSALEIAKRTFDLGLSRIIIRRQVGMESILRNGTYEDGVIIEYIPAGRVGGENNSVEDYNDYISSLNNSNL